MFRLSAHNQNVDEKPPTPITHGIDIQKEKLAELRTKAGAEYTRIARLSRLVNDRIVAELAKGSQADNHDELAKLFEQENALDEIGRKLEGILLRNDEFDDALNERLFEMYNRMSRLEDEE